MNLFSLNNDIRCDLSGFELLDMNKASVKKHAETTPEHMLLDSALNDNQIPVEYNPVLQKPMASEIPLVPILNKNQMSVEQNTVEPNPMAQNSDVPTSLPVEGLPCAIMTHVHINEVQPSQSRVPAMSPSTEKNLNGCQWRNFTKKRFATNV